MRHFPLVYAISTHIISSLGIECDSHWQAVKQGKTGIELHNNLLISAMPFMGSIIDNDAWRVIKNNVQDESLTPFEQMAAFSIGKAMEKVQGAINLDETIFILATTKGNIELASTTNELRLPLSETAKAIASYHGFNTKPIVVSNACTSGVAALLHGLRLLQNGSYKHAVVCGCDRFSRFVLCGFQSFMATSPLPCRPFDADRQGINMGEAAATIILSVNSTAQPVAQLLSGATTNDSNHISGPSRTGEELATAIRRSLMVAALVPEQMNMISAHGTATIFNDEMEAKAFHLSGLANTPLHSFKGFVGHTLGAAGILESAMALESLQKQMLIPSLGFQTSGVTKPVNITTELKKAEINYVLKTSSGFGGCNAAVIWGKC
ncbi:MAG: beta-ketoacyl synthase [Taibaiella sp.]|nr:beta-ketoacyl synthase [Taibaiella sp.]